MKIVIDIPQIMYGAIKQYGITFLSRDDKKTLRKSIANGTPLPAGHGRLIDADALEYTCNADECGMLTGCNHCQYHIVTKHEIDNAPTVIEGSDSE